MLTYATGYLAALVTFVAADMVWLGTMAPRFYRPTLGDIAISGVNLPPAILFYAIYPVGVLIFAISPALKSGFSDHCRRLWRFIWLFYICDL